jgi:four helix bundle protein
MATFKTFEEIKAWQKARILYKKIQLLTHNTGLGKDYKLRDQINAACGSIMDNIAEGFGRGGNKEFIQFLEMSHGSACECQSQLYQILDRNYINKKEFDELYFLCGEVRRIIIGLINYLQKSDIKGIKFIDRSRTS